MASDQGEGDTQQPGPGGTSGSRRKLVRFGITFVVLMGAFYAIFATEAFKVHFFHPYLAWNANASAKVLHLMGRSDAVAKGVAIEFPGFHLEIARGCDGLEGIALYLAVVIAFPTGWRRKLPGLLIGFPLMVLVNLSRIVSLWFVGIYRPDLFHTMHVDVWQILFILAEMVILAVWLPWATRKPATRSSVSP